MQRFQPQWKRCLSIWLIAGVLASLNLLIYCSTKSNAGDTTKYVLQQEGAISRPAEQQVPQARPQADVGGVYEASLEMKENVDFLLTPAMVMQEVVSYESVITYTSE